MNENDLIRIVSEFTMVIKSDKIIEITDDLYGSLNEQQIKAINELKQFKYMLQYYIS